MLRACRTDLAARRQIDYNVSDGVDDSIDGYADPTIADNIVRNASPEPISDAMSGEEPTAAAKPSAVRLRSASGFVWRSTLAVHARRSLTPVLAFALLFYVAVAAVLASAGYGFRLLPIGEAKLAGSALYISLVGPLSVFLIRILQDTRSVLKGGKPPSLRVRLREVLPLARDCLILAVIYLVVLIAYVNLKPAIPQLNPLRYDAAVESLERALFGGILPAQWLTAHSPSWTLVFWDRLYFLLTLFMFVSLTIGLYHDGFVGGSRLVLAYSVGLAIDGFFTLWFPTFGPLFTHPEWFDRTADLHTGVLARFLELTVRQYAESPGHVYACAGISAMPSYHLYAWVCGLAYWRGFPRPVFRLGLALTALNWLSTVLLGWHYALDGLAGILLALLVTWAVAKVIPTPSPHAPQNNRSAAT